MGKRAYTHGKTDGNGEHPHFRAIRALFSTTGQIFSRLKTEYFRQKWVIKSEIFFKFNWKERFKKIAIGRKPHSEQKMAKFLFEG